MRLLSHALRRHVTSPHLLLVFSLNFRTNGSGRALSYCPFSIRLGFRCAREMSLGAVSASSVAIRRSLCRVRTMRVVQVYRNSDTWHAATGLLRSVCRRSSFHGIVVSERTFLRIGFCSSTNYGHRPKSGPEFGSSVTSPLQDPHVDGTKHPS